MSQDEWIGLEVKLHLRMTTELDLERGLDDGTVASELELFQLGRPLLRELHPLLTEDQEDRLLQAVVHRIRGIGPLQPLLDDPSVDEIMVNGPSDVFVERNGRLQSANVVFHDHADIRNTIERIVAPLGRRVDEASPLVDARLQDGSRVNAIIPPLAIGGPTLTIRKFARQPFTLERLIDLGTLEPRLARFLERCVRSRVSLVICGGTGAGKTSTLNALSLAMPQSERLISIEDSAELQLNHPHWIALESRPPNLEGQGEIPIRMLVRNALRMRPDRIIVGEVRGGEAFDMLQAMNTGHRGSLTTLHANSTRDALVRLESMVLMAGFEIPISAIRRMIGSALELIVHQERTAEGRRRVVAVDRVTRSDDERLQLQPVFRISQPSAGAARGWDPVIR